MLPIAIALLSGLIFGSGLLLSGMTNPAKVLGFLDIAGAWDPSLALVMIGAIATSVIPFAIAKKRHTTWLGLPMHLPGSRSIDRRLIFGSLLFGIGWGLAGICPGPALVMLGMGVKQAWLFVSAMLVGMGLFEAIEYGRRQRASA